ncbi:MAG: hypothetical protein PVF15_08160 [Candidatus Bathyarchaeota archaeon]|jgi:23S rRNA pseudoU1915 N3-methylase RlmH
METEVTGLAKQLLSAETTGSLDELVLCAIDETIKNVFKEPGAKVIYDYMETKCHLKWEEIAQKPEVFSASLERLMVSAAQVIEKMVLKNLYCKLGLRFEEKNGYEFSDYMKDLRRSHVGKNMKGV